MDEMEEKDIFEEAAEPEFFPESEPAEEAEPVVPEETVPESEELLPEAVEEATTEDPSPKKAKKEKKQKEKKEKPKKERKGPFWSRKKAYYQFPIWMRIPADLLKIAWGAAKIALGAVAVALGIILIAGVVFATYLGEYLQEDVIPYADYSLESFDLDQTSFIYTVDQENKTITKEQKIYTNTDRIWVAYDEIPEDLIYAAVAIEDKRFFQHQGVDWFTTVKACANMFLGNRSTFGGSTITQQLIKNLSEDDDVTVRRKVMEIFRALKFEEIYTKEEVMEWYLNTIYLGESCYGVQSASRNYFGKDVWDLTAAECASLIGITNNPSLYDPYISMTRNRKRQEIILSEMHSQGYLNKWEYEAAINQKMIFTSVSLSDTLYTCHNCGLIGSRSTYDFNEVDKLYQCPSCGVYLDIPIKDDTDYYSYFEDTNIREVCQDLMDTYGYTYDVAMQLIKTGGFSIYSTIDPKVQAIVDEIYTNLENVPETKSAQQLQSAIVVIDNATGDIVAMAGGVGEKTNYLGLNRATQSKLQPGSSMKPLGVYAPAVELGLITPATVVFDGPMEEKLPKKYPLNYTRVYTGNGLVLDAVTISVNTVPSKILRDMGPAFGFEFAKYNFGLSTLVESVTINGTEKSDIDIAPLALGAPTYGVTVKDMTAAYATFANGGVWREPRSYTKVLDANGNVVLDNTQESRAILSERTNIYMNYMLSQVVKTGTGYNARISGMNVAGKTGTTSDNRDRWFVGYTPYYTAAVWCGFDQPEQIRLKGSSNNPAVRMWRLVMGPLHEGLKKIDLYDDSDLRSTSICSHSGLLATDACKADIRGTSCAVTVYLFKKDVPKEECTAHVMVDWCDAGGGLANPWCSLSHGNTVSKRSMVLIDEVLQKMYEDAEIDASGFTISEATPTCTMHSMATVIVPEAPGPAEPTEPTEPPAP